ncbi:MAG: permease [Actinomycetota bacterium]
MGMTFGGLMMEGLKTLYEYVAQHTLFCLVPAFFIAGAIAAFLNTAAVMKYFGPRTNKALSYSVASVSGAILAVCSCTVLPLFTGIREKGAGLGPAVAFLYSAPAINILAMTYSIHLLGYDLGVARIIGALGFAFVIGLIMAGIFHREEERRIEEAEASGVFAYGDGGRVRPGHQNLAFFGVLIAILVYGTAKMPTIIRYAGEVLLLALLIHLVKRWFTREEIRTWFFETWRMVRMILPVLLIGVFLVGVIKKLIPSDVIARYVGGNTIVGNAIASVSGALMYFATLTEVPIVKGLLELGMGKGPALALMLAGPALSLPSMIVLIRIMGFKRAGTYILLVCIFALVTGYVFGMFAG